MWVRLHSPITCHIQRLSHGNKRVNTQLGFTLIQL
jgi:hypothetical protein